MAHPNENWHLRSEEHSVKLWNTNDFGRSTNGWGEGSQRERFLSYEHVVPKKLPHVDSIVVKTLIKKKKKKSLRNPVWNPVWNISSEISVQMKKVIKVWHLFSLLSFLLNISYQVKEEENFLWKYICPYVLCERRECSNSI